MPWKLSKRAQYIDFSPQLDGLLTGLTKLTDWVYFSSYKNI